MGFTKFKVKLNPLDLVVSKFKNSAKILNVFKYKFMEIS